VSCSCSETFVETTVFLEQRFLTFYLTFNWLKIEMRFAAALVLVALLLLFLLIWAPWLDDKEVHDRVLREKGGIDGTIQPMENLTASEAALEEMREYSRSKGVTDGVLICDYEVTWLPFGRWVASCEGGYYVTFFGTNSS
jgi:hypothetical protein